MPTAFSLSLTARTSAFKDVKTSAINSRLAGSSSTTRSFRSATCQSSSASYTILPNHHTSCSEVTVSRFGHEYFLITPFIEHACVERALLPAAFDLEPSTAAGQASRFYGFSHSLLRRFL